MRLQLKTARWNMAEGYKMQHGDAVMLFQMEISVCLNEDEMWAQEEESIRES